MQRLLQILEPLALGLILVGVLLWIGDWAVFHTRMAHGNGFDSVQVQEYLSTPLKGSKQEYDYLGTMPESCARSLFPHGGAPACWWLRRHTSQWE